MVGHVTCLPRVIPQRPHNFKWQSSGRFSITVQPLTSVNVTAVTMYQRPRVHLGRPTWRPCMGVDNTDHLVSRDWAAASFSFCGYRCHSGTTGSTRIPAPPPLWLQKHTDLRAQYFVHPLPPTCNVSLGSLTVAMPEARDFVESLETHTVNCWFKILLNSFQTVRCIEVSGI